MKKRWEEKRETAHRMTPSPSVAEVENCKGTRMLRGINVDVACVLETETIDTSTN